MTLAFGAVAATCATTAALRVGLPMASLHTRGVSWSRPAATPAAGRLARSARRPRRAWRPSARAWTPGPLPGGGARADRAAAGAGIYQPDWDEIDLGDEFMAESERSENERRAPPKIPRQKTKEHEPTEPTLGSYSYEDDGSVPWTRGLLPGYREENREENRAMNDLVERDALALEDESRKPKADLDAFEGAFGDGDGGLANAPRLRSLDRASRDAEASERAWDAEASENFADEKGSRYEDAYENGLDARLELDGDAYEASLRGDLDASYADAERAERRRRVKIARRREHARDLDLYEAKKSRAEAGTGTGTGTRGTTRAEASLGAARRGGEGGTNPPDSYFDYDAPDYVPPGLVPVPRPFTDYDYAPYDYDYDYGDYDYAGTGTGAAAAGTEARRGRGRGSVSRPPRACL